MTKEHNMKTIDYSDEIERIVTSGKTTGQIIYELEMIRDIMESQRQIDEETQHHD